MSAGLPRLGAQVDVVETMLSPEGQLRARIRGPESHLFGWVSLTSVDGTPLGLPGPPPLMAFLTFISRQR